MDKTTYKTTKSELVRVDLPEETKSYKPITHEQLIDLTLNSIAGAGFELEKEWYESAREGQIATGHYAIRNIADDEMQLRIAWQNSYNKQVSLKFALGVHVFICANGCCSGDMGSFRRKHTGDVQDFTPTTIEEYIKSAGETFIQMQGQRDAMKEIELSKRVQAELLGRMYIEEDFIESTQMNIIKRELSKPTYDYGAPNSLWEMYQFTTFAMRSIHPSLWMKDHLAANSFFITQAGLYVPKTESVAISVKDSDVSPNQMDMSEVPGFTEAEDVSDTAELAEKPFTGIEINNVVEEEDDPISEASYVNPVETPDVEHIDIEMPDNDSKLDVVQDSLPPEVENLLTKLDDHDESAPTTNDSVTTEYDDLR